MELTAKLPTILTKVVIHFGQKITKLLIRLRIYKGSSVHIRIESCCHHKPVLNSTYSTNYEPKPNLFIDFLVQTSMALK